MPPLDPTAKILASIAELSKCMDKQFAELRLHIAKRFANIHVELAQQGTNLRGEIAQQFAGIDGGIGKHFAKESADIRVDLGKRLVQQCTDVRAGMGKNFAEVCANMRRHAYESRTDIRNLNRMVDNETAEVRCSLTAIDDRLLDFEAALLHIQHYKLIHSEYRFQ